MSSAEERCEFQDLAAGAALNALEPDEDVALRQHLPECARCRSVLRSSKEAASYLGANVPQQDPPAALRERILAEAARTRQVDAHRPVPEQVGSVQREVEPMAEVRRLQPRRRRGSRVLAAAAGIVVIAVISVLGVRVGQLSGEQQIQAEQSQQTSRAIAALNDQDAGMTVLRANDGSKVATLVSGEHDAAVVPGNLQPNDQNHMYVVWGMSKGKPVAVAQFTLGGANAQALRWSGEAAQHRAYAISLEEGKVAPAEPTTVVAHGTKAA